MKMKGNTQAKRRSPPHLKTDEQPLLRFLVEKATSRGDTLAVLAKKLGVTYTRLAQWRRQEADIRNARRPVLERAAAYLGWPVLYVLVHAGVVRMTDFTWPGLGTLDDCLAQEIAMMRRDRNVGPLVPPALEQTDLSLRLLAVYLFRALGQASRANDSQVDWLEEMRQAAEMQFEENNRNPATGRTKPVQRVKDD